MQLHCRTVKQPFDCNHVNTPLDVSNALEKYKCVCVWVRVCQTLCADQHQRQVRGVPVVGEAAEVVINRLKADLILQTEDEDHGIDPQRKLQTESWKNTLVNIHICS